MARSTNRWIWQSRLLRLTADVVGAMTIDRDSLERSAGADFSVAADLAEAMVLDGGIA